MKTTGKMNNKATTNEGADSGWSGGTTSDGTIFDSAAARLLSSTKIPSEVVLDYGSTVEDPEQGPVGPASPDEQHPRPTSIFAAAGAFVVPPVFTPPFAAIESLFRLLEVLRLGLDPTAVIGEPSSTAGGEQDHVGSDPVAARSTTAAADVAPGGPGGSKSCSTTVAAEPTATSTVAGKGLGGGSATS
ncbi:unnamed protein product [Amoebophrya sp. A120]|nr:unnamed protein product [Amoebophrya sp. A120]|eukprot:GSA120T00022926001.1